jgi:hypothetical protein
MRISIQNTIKLGYSSNQVNIAPGYRFRTTILDKVRITTHKQSKVIEVAKHGNSADEKVCIVWMARAK